jgi:subtilisin family serine protease
MVAAQEMHSAASTELAVQLLVMVREQPVRRYRPGPVSLSTYRSGSAGARTLRTARALAREYGFDIVSDWPMPALAVRCLLVRVPRAAAVPDLVQRLDEDPRVEWAQPQQLFRVASGGDPYYPLQSGAQRMHLDALHRMATGRNVKVAQIDTGVELRHPDLHGQMAGAHNFVDGSAYAQEIHGTAVAGIIAARRGNDVGIVGVAPGARLLALRACWEPADGSAALCSSFTLAKALQFAIDQRAQVINLSLTGPRDRLLERLVDRAAQEGIVLVAAARGAQPEFPAALPAVIAVAAQGAGPAPEGALLAPGHDVLSASPNASWGFFSGASFAAAHVSGVAALMLERSRQLPAGELRSVLLRHSRTSPAGGRILDACAAIAQMAPQRRCACCGENGRHPATLPRSSPPA